MAPAASRTRRPMARDQLLTEVSEPPAILAQTPIGTLSQASVCASFLDVPAQDEVAVWQSFLPALAMPKHFSVAGSWAWTWPASSSAVLSAAAMVSVVFIPISLAKVSLLGGRTLPRAGRSLKYRVPMGTMRRGYRPSRTKLRSRPIRLPVDRHDRLGIQVSRRARC